MLEVDASHMVSSHNRHRKQCDCVAHYRGVPVGLARSKIPGCGRDHQTHESAIRSD